MSLEKKVSRENVNEKLRNLVYYMPRKGFLFYEFGHFLAERMGKGEISPQGFVTAAEFAIYDLERGRDGYSQKPIISSLVGCPAIFYEYLHLNIPEIGDALFPKKFAREVARFYKKAYPKKGKEADTEVSL